MSATTLSAATCITAYIEYMRLYFSEKDAVKLWGEVTGKNLYREYRKYDDSQLAGVIFWQYLLTDAERQQLADYVCQQYQNLIK